MRYGTTGILGVLRLYLASRFAGSLGAAQDDSLKNYLRRRHTNVKNGLDVYRYPPLPWWARLFRPLGRAGALEHAHSEFLK